LPAQVVKPVTVLASISVALSSMGTPPFGARFVLTVRAARSLFPPTSTPPRLPFRVTAPSMVLAPQRLPRSPSPPIMMKPAAVEDLMAPPTVELLHMAKSG